MPIDALVRKLSYFSVAVTLPLVLLIFLCLYFFLLYRAIFSRTSFGENGKFVTFNAQSAQWMETKEEEAAKWQCTGCDLKWLNLFW